MDCNHCMKKTDPTKRMIQEHKTLSKNRTNTSNGKKNRTLAEILNDTSIVHDRQKKIDKKQRFGAFERKKGIRCVI